ncbi:hypothetical protein CPC08DRAFT_262465 [Agrocybe pediades]|nr:hypothetical protein CPC08DRAFT_262465 [Agrocybe pediades]
MNFALLNLSQWCSLDTLDESLMSHSTLRLCQTMTFYILYSGLHPSSRPPPMPILRRPVVCYVESGVFPGSNCLKCLLQLHPRHVNSNIVYFRRTHVHKKIREKIMMKTEQRALHIPSVGLSLFRHGPPSEEHVDLILSPAATVTYFLNNLVCANICRSSRY